MIPVKGRRQNVVAQAVIIDHLMPPMTRAEVYGDLADLEGLVDEYYHAMGMDTRREAWLREKIIEQVGQTNIISELAFGQLENDDDVETEILNQLDTYLCDIKEAQIRHGLHVLGALPEDSKLSDTLVALLRLPRGSAASEQGILHNLVADMQLTHNDQLFDPLQTDVETWQGDKPAHLVAVDERPWRTTADTRERLELLAIQWVEKYVIQESTTAEISVEFSVQYPRTADQFTYTKDVLHKALAKGVELEIQSLVNGLAGEFVEPGPSGAPTRGRLDTLPTGRNFFSVDNRAIPSPAAWAIGERSAQSLIERHLQEHGDYPNQLGLSVWGTATMRTGGDDIAQAFSLMGIKPVWAAGSHRVIDF